MKILDFLPVFFLFLFFSMPSHANNNVKLFANNDSRKIQFAIDELQSALNEKEQKIIVSPISQISKLKNNEHNIVLLNVGDKTNSQLLNSLSISNIEDLESEGFIIYKSDKNSKTVWIVGKDDAGVMYGGLEVAEIIQVQGIEHIDNQLQNPYMKVRGTKFNIPLDVRTPTYTEPSATAQNNMAEMWNFEFWNTGNTGSWVWERITVNLAKGENSVAISPMGWVLLDHLNIIKY